jgi:hypothetical protein
MAQRHIHGMIISNTPPRDSPPPQDLLVSLRSRQRRELHGPDRHARGEPLLDVLEQRQPCDITGRWESMEDELLFSCSYLRGRFPLPSITK